MTKMNNQSPEYQKQFRSAPPAVQTPPYAPNQPGQMQSPVPVSNTGRTGSGLNPLQQGPTTQMPPIQAAQPYSTSLQTGNVPFRTQQWRKRQKLVIFSILCLLLLVGAGGFSFWHFVLKGSPNVTLYRVSMKSVTQNVGSGGLAFPTQRLDVSFPFTAMVLSVFVKPGDKVLPNEPLVQIDLAQVNAQNLVTLQSHSNEDAPALPNGDIPSTIRGTVISVNVFPGQFFYANKVMLTIYDESSIIVHVKIPLANYGQIHLNQATQVMPSALSNVSLRGTVTSIILSADSQAATFDVWVTVPNPTGQLLPGMSIFVQIQETVQALVVPRLAVLNPDQGATVFVIRQQHAYIQQVQVSGYAADSLIISSGLQTNELVVLVGLDSLSDGQAVHISTIES
jgi:multidrug efflux pump subunit AcrA (membrane-fusion protein)